MMIDWLWEPFLAPGTTTVLAAPPKSGKTTFLAALLKALETSPGNREFVGCPVRGIRVLYVTEEPPQVWAKRARDLGLGDHVTFIARPWNQGVPKTQANWEALCRVLAERVRTEKFRLVIFDTLANLWPNPNEDKANEIGPALDPISQIAAEGAAVILVHHTRKSGGDNGAAVRGSGAITGWADTVIELRVSSEGKTQRTLVTMDRFGEAPSSWKIDFDRETRRFRKVDASEARADKDAVHLRLFGCEPLSIREAMKRGPDSLVEKTLRRHAEKFVKQGQLMKDDSQGPAEYWLAGCTGAAAN
jgi:hypothetical protein